MSTEEELENINKEYDESQQPDEDTGDTNHNTDDESPRADDMETYIQEYEEKFHKDEEQETEGETIELGEDYFG